MQEKVQKYLENKRMNLREVQFNNSASYLHGGNLVRHVSNMKISELIDSWLLNGINLTFEGAIDSFVATIGQLTWSNMTNSDMREIDNLVKIEYSKFYLSFLLFYMETQFPNDYEQYKLFLNKFKKFL